jgi:arsenite methyltransferase
MFYLSVSGDSDCCCMPECCSSDSSAKQAMSSIGYDKDELESIPESSILGVGCGFIGLQLLLEHHLSL